MESLYTENSLFPTTSLNTKHIMFSSALEAHCSVLLIYSPVSQYWC